MKAKWVRKLLRPSSPKSSSTSTGPSTYSLSHPLPQPFQPQLHSLPSPPISPTSPVKKRAIFGFSHRNESVPKLLTMVFSSISEHDPFRQLRRSHSTLKPTAPNTSHTVTKHEPADTNMDKEIETTTLYYYPPDPTEEIFEEPQWRHSQQLDTKDIRLRSNSLPSFPTHTHRARPKPRPHEITSLPENYVQYLKHQQEQYEENQRFSPAPTFQQGKQQRHGLGRYARHSGDTIAALRASAARMFDSASRPTSPSLPCLSTLPAKGKHLKFRDHPSCPFNTPCVSDSIGLPSILHARIHHINSLSHALKQRVADDPNYELLLKVMDSLDGSVEGLCQKIGTTIGIAPQQHTGSHSGTAAINVQDIVSSPRTPPTSTTMSPVPLRPRRSSTSDIPPSTHKRVLKLSSRRSTSVGVSKTQPPRLYQASSNGTTASSPITAGPPSRNNRSRRPSCCSTLPPPPVQTLPRVPLCKRPSLRSVSLPAAPIFFQPPSGPPPPVPVAPPQTERLHRLRSMQQTASAEEHRRSGHDGVCPLVSQVVDSHGETELKTVPLVLPQDPEMFSSDKPISLLL
ncbi:hypothetical protein BC939DRAFT_501111 [Gamsiella multidivaricata]|uniref:uncharacterized protein n=1 Tax=Gamsiella multidivaricata TaxID=101098 RepID=UPI00221F9BE5|nr:uncharacterized protein BC939DRAFT_501111 [Gamsiella multidivaricata]KAI7827564.1 hypothetical protein BC939DRAFT_501111 [Gamsiella multidivaricata]